MSQLDSIVPSKNPRNAKAEKRWMFPAIGLMTNIILGTIYSWSVFRTPLEGMFKWTSVESSLPFTVFLLLFAVMMPIGGKLMEKIGPRKTALLGGIMVGIGWFLASLAARFPYPLAIMLVFYGVIAGAGVGIIYGVPIAVSSRWIPERRGLAVGITVMGFGLSPLLTAPLARYLITTVGVLETFFYFGIAFLLFLVLFSFSLSFPPSELTQPIKTQAKTATQATEFLPNQMIKTVAFYGVWLAFMLGTIGGFIAISLAAKYGEEVVKLGPELAAISTALFAVFNGAGRPIFGSMCDKFGVKNTALISFFVISLAALFATQAQTLAIYLVSLGLLWFTFGGWLTIAPTATSKFFGLKHQGINYGIVFTAYGIGALVGPSLASYIYDTIGTYSPAFLTIAALAMTGAVVVFLTFGTKPTAQYGQNPKNN